MSYKQRRDSSGVLVDTVAEIEADVIRLQKLREEMKDQYDKDDLKSALYTINEEIKRRLGQLAKEKIKGH